jgi:DNA-binding GntR family transcriptional regulator
MGVRYRPEKRETQATGMNFLTPIEVEATSGLIAQRLRAAIASGQLAHGTQLVETELCAMFSVSRGPLREALQRLVQEGLLRSVRNRGIFVKSFDLEDVRDIYVTRAALESAAATLIFRRGDQRRTGERLRHLTDTGEVPADFQVGLDFPGHDFRFHQLIIQDAQSKRLVGIYQTLLIETTMCVETLQATAPDAGSFRDAHAAIAAAFREGQADALPALLAHHLDETEGLLTARR